MKTRPHACKGSFSICVRVQVFMPAVTLTARLLTAPDAPVRVARTPGVLKQWEGIAQILIRRIEMERKYICRLEGEHSHFLHTYRHTYVSSTLPTCPRTHQAHEPPHPVYRKAMRMRS